MECFLICTNPKCRFVVNLREGAQVLERSKLVIDECPECGHPWSSYCPLCGRRLEGTQQGEFYHCLNCRKNLRADGDVTLRSSLAIHMNCLFDTNSLNEYVSVPFWLAPPIQTLLNHLCSVQRPGRTHAIHQNRPIQSRATSDDFARNYCHLNRMFLAANHRGSSKSLPKSPDNPAFFHSGTYPGF